MCKVLQVEFWYKPSASRLDRAKEVVPDIWELPYEQDGKMDDHDGPILQWMLEDNWRVEMSGDGVYIIQSGVPTEQITLPDAPEIAQAVFIQAAAWREANLNKNGVNLHMLMSYL